MVLEILGKDILEARRKEAVITGCWFDVKADRPGFSDKESV
jgi:hypothetical protein